MPAHSRMFTAVLRSALPLITVACVHDSLVAPVGRQAPAPVRSVSGPIGSQVFPVKPYNENWDNPGTPFQDTLVWGGMPVNATLRVTVSGTVTLGPPPTLSGFTMTRNTTYMGQSIGPKGITGIYSTYGVPLQVHAGIINPAYGLTIDSATGDGSIILRTGPSASALVLQRNGIAGEWQCMSPQVPPPQIRQPTCDDGNAVLSYTHPGYYRTSQQTVSVERLEDDVTLHGVTSTGDTGRVVLFTPVPLDGTQGGGPMGYTWRPDTTPGRTAVTCASNANPCSQRIEESGTMDVAWWFPNFYGQGSTTRHASTHVDAIPCPTGDTLLDRAALRRALFTALANSHPDATPGSGVKVEVSVDFWLTDDGRLLTTVVSDPTANECSVHAGQTAPPEPGARLVAIAHTHPSATGEETYGCPSNPKTNQYWSQHPGDGLPVAISEPDKQGGGSPSDWQEAATDSVTSYIISKEFHISRLDPTNQPSPHWHNLNRWDTSGHAVGCYSRITPQPD